MPDGFVHLHVHTEYSMLDGAMSCDEYADEIDGLDQVAGAIADHGHLDGSDKWYRAMTARGRKPIIGAEFYLSPAEMGLKKPVWWGTPDQRREDVSGGGAYTHLTVLATGAEGLSEMYRLQADSYDRGYYYKPRVDRARLAQNPGGLIVLSGCASGELATRLRLGQPEEADEVADWYKQHFGDRYYIELMFHDIPWERALIDELLIVAKRHRIETVATNDAHYRTRTDDALHRALLCVQTQSPLSRPAMEFDGSGYFVRNRREMEALGLPKKSLDNTLAVAERIGSYDDAFAYEPRFPEYPLPDGWTASDALRDVTERGLRRKIPPAKLGRYLTDLYGQLDVISNAGYDHYFLVLWHILSEARREGIRVGPGRGSVVGSMVAFAADITELDPIVHGLIPERFLNPDRLSWPDADIDIPDRDRPRFLAMVERLYGAGSVVQICTYGTFGAKAALKDACRVLGLPAATGDVYAAQLPRAEFGRAAGLDKYTGPRDEVFNLAEGFAGRKRTSGIHASGVVIATGDLTSQMPLRRPGGDGPWVTGLTDKEVERRGRPKMDFLGLRNLTNIDDCLEHLAKQGVEVELSTDPEKCNDRKTYDLLSRGDTLGCFQTDGRQMRQLLRRVGPDALAVIFAVLALLRPGPMGANAHILYADRRNTNSGEWQSEWAIHPELEEALRPVLAETYGLIIFQEQVLEILKVLCGWSYADADTLFYAMRKKDREEMAATRPAYEAAGLARGYAQEALTALWEVLVPFADYSFNKAHAAAYGVLAYWTAYLKANYPVEYMAATLSSVANEPEKLPEYLAECSRMGLRILPPSINGGFEFTPGSDGIHYGLGAIKGVGASVYAGILESRGNRPFSSLRDFFSRVDLRALSAGTLKALVASGALDTLCPRREELYIQQTELAARAIRWRAESAFGQRMLLEPTYPVWPRGMYSSATRREWEQQYLGATLTEQPIELGAIRRVTQEELEWLRMMLARNPGSSPVTLLIGGHKMSLPPTNWPAIEAAIESVGIFDVSAP